MYDDNDDDSKFVIVNFDNVDYYDFPEREKDRLTRECVEGLSIKKSVTLVAPSGVLVEPGQRDKLAATISCNSTQSYRIISCNKSIATGQISQRSRNRA